MFQILRLLLGTITRIFCARRSLLLENLMLQQQLAVFKRRVGSCRRDLPDHVIAVNERFLDGEGGALHYRMLRPLL